MRAESSWHFTQPWPESITLIDYLESITEIAVEETDR